MTAEEEKAHHRGRNAAQLDARKINPGERTRCEFRTPALRRAWESGYAAQEAAARAPRTLEQESKVEDFCAGIRAWLERTK